MTFAVTLSEAATSDVTFRWQTQDDTARQTTDYEPGSGTITFTSGETTKTITIGIRDDADVEGTHQFRLALTSADGAVITDGVGMGRITDDD